MGHVTVVGGCRAKAPSTGILASTLPVGSTVKLMEGGTAVDYLVVNQGIPENSSLYDASCDGTWLLRKYIHSERQWHTSDVNKYETSAINTWLNGDFFNALGSAEQATIKQVKIPYRKNGGSGGTDESGANGLPVNAFLLGGYEMGWTNSDSSYIPADGAKLDYFGIGSAGDSIRIAYLSGTATVWWLRSPNLRNDIEVWSVMATGGYSSNYSPASFGVRPAVILPSNALFDKTTMLLKGVA